MTVTRYRHPVPLREAEVGLYIRQASLEAAYGRRAEEADPLNYLPPEMREGVTVETAPSADHFTVRDLLVEFYQLEGALRARVLAGDEDDFSPLNIALAAYRAGLADCDCRDD